MMSPRPHHIREQEWEDDASGETARRLEEEQAIEAARTLRVLPGDFEIDGQEHHLMSETMRQWLDDGEAGR